MLMKKLLQCICKRTKPYVSTEPQLRQTFATESKSLNGQDIAATARSRARTVRLSAYPCLRFRIITRTGEVSQFWLFLLVCLNKGKAYIGVGVGNRVLRS
jgi:hypothetical protein